MMTALDDEAMNCSPNPDLHVTLLAEQSIDTHENALNAARR